MSMIPSESVGGALAPLQRSTHESILARKLQVQKNARHSEDVEGLDDTAVNSVRDQNQRQGRQEKEHAPKHEGERVEISALQGAGEAPPPPRPDEAPPSRLDISA